MTARIVCLIAIALVGAVVAEETAVLGLPLTGITSRELELFRLGREDFL